jgi:glycosyltransferase involved in cell wall biosynthesis
MVARLQAEGIWKGRLIYEAHNFEFGLKSSICETTWVVNAIKRIELACYQASDLVTTCSVDDLKLMQEFYGNKNHLIIPNGVDINSIQFISPEKRRDNKLKLGISSKYFLALFMGSDHMPNQEALKNIFKAAPFCKDVIFLIIGSVCNPFFKENIPENVRLIGMVDEFTKNQFLGCTDIGLNPLKSGSGTNLKMAEYAASGIWIISTQVGGRGFWITNEHYSPIREKCLASDLNKLIESTKTDHIDKLIYQAYIHIRTFGNWDDAITPLVDILKIN